MANWPWHYVRGFKVESLANSQMLVTPDYDPERVRPWTEQHGGGPGLPLRLAVAEWIEGKLTKRIGRKPTEAPK